MPIFRVASGCIWGVQLRIDISCAKCGSNRFAIDGAVADDARIRCEDCTHEIGTFAQLKERVAAEVLSRARTRDSKRA